MLIRRPLKPVFDIKYSTDTNILLEDLLTTLNPTPENVHVSPEAKAFIQLMLETIKKQAPFDKDNINKLLTLFIGGIIGALTIDDAIYERNEAEAAYPSHTWESLIHLYSTKIDEDVAEPLSKDDSMLLMEVIGIEVLDKHMLAFNRDILEKKIKLATGQSAPLLPGILKEYNKLEMLLNLSQPGNAKIYIDQYKLQLNARRIRTLLVVLAAIFLTPLSLLISIPLWLRAKHKEPIQNITTTPAILACVKANRGAFWHSHHQDNHSQNPSKPKKVIISRDKNKVEILADKFAVNRFNLFARNDIKGLTPRAIGYSQKNSEDLLAALQTHHLIPTRTMPHAHKPPHHPVILTASPQTHPHDAKPRRV
jgi:hypothetical protein